MTWSRPATGSRCPCRRSSRGIHRTVEEEVVVIGSTSISRQAAIILRRTRRLGRRDPVLLREVDEVPDDEEVVGEAHLANQSSTRKRRSWSRASRCRTAWPGLRRPPRLPGAHLGHWYWSRILPRSISTEHRSATPSGARARPRAREVGRHLLGRLEEELVGVESPVRRVLERAPDWMHERLVASVLGVEVADVPVA